MNKLICIVNIAVIGTLLTSTATLAQSRTTVYVPVPQVQKVQPTPSPCMFACGLGNLNNKVYNSLNLKGPGGQPYKQFVPAPPPEKPLFNPKGGNPTVGNGNGKRYDLLSDPKINIDRSTNSDYGSYVRSRP